MISTGIPTSIAIFRCGRVLGERTNTGAQIDTTKGNLSITHSDEGVSALPPSNNRRKSG